MDLSSLIFSETALKFPNISKIQNTPPITVKRNLKKLFHQVIFPLKAVFGDCLEITSCYRCPELNRLVGGVENSQHVTGEAVDLVLNIMPAQITKILADYSLIPVKTTVQNGNYGLFAFLGLQAENFNFDQLIHEGGIGIGEPGWVHVSITNERTPRKQILITGNYLSGYRQIEGVEIYHYF